MEDKSPTTVIESFFEAFNNADEFTLDAIFDNPWFLITGKKSRVFQKYSDAVDFEFLRESGWHHSKINTIETIHRDPETSLVAFNFSRLTRENREIYTADATHLILHRHHASKIKTIFVNGEMTLSLE